MPAQILRAGATGRGAGWFPASRAGASKRTGMSCGGLLASFVDGLLQVVGGGFDVALHRLLLYLEALRNHCRAEILQNTQGDDLALPFRKAGDEFADTFLNHFVGGLGNADA